MNGAIYDFVTFVLQASQAHNITIDSGRGYNVSSEEITVEKFTFGSPQNLTPYALATISGADDFNDNTAITDVFDIIVNNAREAIATCEFSLFTQIYSFHSPAPNQVGAVWSLW